MTPWPARARGGPPPPRAPCPPTTLVAEYPALGLARDPALAQLDRPLDAGVLIRRVTADPAAR